MRQYTVTDVNGCKVVEGMLPLSDMGALLDAWKDLEGEDDPWIADGMLAHHLGAALVVGPKVACNEWRLRFRATSSSAAPTAEDLQAVQDGEPVQFLTEHIRPHSVYGSASGEAREVKHVFIDLHGKTQVEFELAPTYSTSQADPEAPVRGVVGIHEFAYWANSVLATQSPDLVRLVAKRRAAVDANQSIESSSPMRDVSHE